MKGKEWKSRVSKSGQEQKNKVQDVVVNVGLMEWNGKEQVLKAKRGKKLPLRVMPTVSYNTLRNEAEEKWKNFHSNLYDESQSYHLLYEDGTKALFLPGSKKEVFTLSRYQEEIGKDFKRITLYLCSNYDFEISEGYFDDEELTGFEKDGDNDLKASMESEKPAKRARCYSPIDLNTVAIKNANQIEIDHQLSNENANQVECARESSNQIELDHQLASQMQEMYNNEGSGELQDVHKNEDTVTRNEDTSPGVDFTDSCSVVTTLAEMVDENGRLFIVVRRGSPLNRVLSIWNREMKKSIASTHPVVRVHFAGEEGIDSGAMAKEFFTLTLPNIGSVMFPGGKPLDSTFHVQNGNFKGCGEIVASSLAQGGPAPCFLDESVYSLLVNPSVPVHELDPEKHLTPSDRNLLSSIRTDITSHTDTIIEHGYTSSIDDSHIEEILKSIAISIVTRRVLYLKEFLEGLNVYGLGSIIQSHPEACKALFVKDVHNDDDQVDANFLFSSLRPSYSPKGSSRRTTEESIMDFFQDFLFNLEDEPRVNAAGYAEAIASNDTDDPTNHTNTEVVQTHVQFQCPDCSPAGVLGWLTGQKHKPINGEEIRIDVKFNHDCITDNPNHRICFPVVGACAKEITFPVAHMKTADEFNEVFIIALSKGQSFGKA